MRQTSLMWVSGCCALALLVLDGYGEIDAEDFLTRISTINLPGIGDCRITGNKSLIPI